MLSKIEITNADKLVFQAGTARRTKDGHCLLTLRPFREVERLFAGLFAVITKEASSSGGEKKLDRAPEGPLVRQLARLTIHKKTADPSDDDR